MKAALQINLVNFINSLTIKNNNKSNPFRHRIITEYALLVWRLNITMAWEYTSVEDEIRRSSGSCGYIMLCRQCGLGLYRYKKITVNLINTRKL